MRRLFNITLLIVVLIVILSTSNLWKNYFSEYWNKNNTVSTWGIDSNSWSSFTNSEIILNENKTMPINWNLWKNEKITKELILYILYNIKKEIENGNPETSLNMYERALKLSNNSKLLTGINLISETEYERILILKNQVDQKINELDSINQKILKESSSINKSDLFIEKWNLEHKIWSYFSYLWLTRWKYEAPSLYYHLKSIQSFDESIKLNDNHLAHKLKWIECIETDLCKNIWIKELEKSISMGDNSDEIYFSLWNAYFKKETIDKANSSYFSGLLLNNKHERMKLWLANSYYGQNNTLSGHALIMDLTSNCVEYCNLVYFQVANMEISWGWMDNWNSNEILSFLDRAIESSRKKGETFRRAYDLKWDMLYKLWRKEEAIKSYHSAKHSMYDPPLSDYENNTNLNEQNTYYKLAKTYYEIWDIWHARWFLQEALRNFFPGDKKLKKYLQEIEK